MLELYSKLDPIIESLFLNAGMSVRSTDFLMLGVAMLALLLIGLVYLGLSILYIRILIRAYRNMIYNKSARLRRNWSLIFVVTLIIGLAWIVISFM